MNQAESFAVTMPPVTTLPANGPLGNFLDVGRDLGTDGGDGRGFPLGLGDVAGEHVGTPERGMLGRNRRHRSQAGAGPSSSLTGLW